MPTRPLFLLIALAERRVAPGRFEYSSGEFLLIGLGLVGVTILGLFVARLVRENRDARLSASSGGWRIRADLDLDLPDPFSRFAGLVMRGPHNVMEGTEEGVEVAYFDVTEGRRTRIVRPCALVQVAEDPPRVTLDTTHGRPSGAALEPWGAAARQVLAEVQGVRIETAPLAILVQSTGASADTVSRVALALAKAVVADAAAPPAGQAPPAAR